MIQARWNDLEDGEHARECILFFANSPRVAIKARHIHVEAAIWEQKREFLESFLYWTAKMVILQALIQTGLVSPTDASTQRHFSDSPQKY